MPTISYKPKHSLMLVIIAHIMDLYFMRSPTPDSVTISLTLGPIMHPLTLDIVDLFFRSPTQDSVTISLTLDPIMHLLTLDIVDFLILHPTTTLNMDSFIYLTLGTL
jgi:hypothetical protein